MTESVCVCSVISHFLRSRLVDAKSLAKHGLYVSKDGLESFILDKAKALPLENGNALAMATVAKFLIFCM